MSRAASTNRQPGVRTLTRVGVPLRGVWFFMHLWPFSRAGAPSQRASRHLPWVRFPRTKAQPHRQKPRLTWDQLDEFLGRQAAIRRLSTHQHRPEGARIALSETMGAEVAQRPSSPAAATAET